MSNILCWKLLTTKMNATYQLRIQVLQADREAHSGLSRELAKITPSPLVQQNPTCSHKSLLGSNQIALVKWEL